MKDPCQTVLIERRDLQLLVMWILFISRSSMSPVKNSHFQLNKSYLFTFLHLFVLQAASYNPLYEVYYTIFFGKGKLKYKESYVPPQSPLNSILRLSTASASLEPGLNETVPFVI